MNDTLPTRFIHPTAVIDDGASIGKGTRVWHFSHVFAGAVIGADCTIGQNVVIANNVRVGTGCKIQNNVSLYEGVILEDYVFCGPSMVFTNVRTPRCLHPRNTSSDYVQTLIKRGASIGANATLLCGVTVGAHALIGAGAVVTRDVPAYGLVYGNPGELRGWACECGIPLRFSGLECSCAECGRKYALDRGKAVPSK